jgi:enoyl-CoA hydratase/carnithine racemase
VTAGGLSLELDGERPLATLWLQRPERGNAFTPEMLRAFPSAVERAAESGARVLVLRGRGQRAFCAGYDLHRLEESFDDGVDAGGQALQQTLAALEEFPGATVALLNGAAIGGGALLALSCDLRWAHCDAFVQVPIARLGLVYPLRGIRALVAAVGSARALEVLHTGRKVTAEEALAWGLVNGVGSGATWDRAAQAAIAAMADSAPLSLEGHGRLVRQLIRDALDAERADAIAQRALNSQDAREGALALRSKRPPRFRGD